tara:strand:+ start:159 stop:563 length:405 start_codon:yes stop_codon:yes gene_type:complete
MKGILSKLISSPTKVHHLPAKIPQKVRIYLHHGATDMRKSFDSLSALTNDLYHESPFYGALYIFLNRKRDRMKVLYRDMDGICIWMKRLDQGLKFLIPSSNEQQIMIDRDQMAVLLEGISLKQLQSNELNKPSK